MEFRKCPNCGDYGFFPRHRCPPYWIVRVPEDNEHYDGEEDVITIHARDAEQAAERFAEQWDYDDMLTGTTLTVEVAPQSDPTITQRFTVESEWVPKYRARLVKDNDEGHPDET